MSGADGTRGRKSLAQFGGAITTRGDPSLAPLLAAAWRAASGPGRELTHGFHAYPARSHPRLVRTLIAALSRPGDVVVDPFCGSGTTVIEGCAAGRRALGCDVNGVALRLARLKSWAAPPAARRELLAAARRIARRGGTRGRGDADAAAAPAELRGWFAPHVWRELDVLGRAIDEVAAPQLHGALLLVLSSLLTKVSHRLAETSDERVEKRIAQGFASRLFAERASELVDGLAALATAAARTPGTPRPRIVQADARALPFASGCARLVLTSPPYFGTYDYAEAQALRARLLSIPLLRAQEREIGARARANEAPARALARYGEELAAALREAGRVVAPDGVIVVILGDGSAGGTIAHADECVDAAAPRARLQVVAAAAQARGARRREHLIVLRRGE